ncbi:tubulin-tyrosine ligase family domain-containing protein [Ditylenchus destructor]|uniref:Tubulin--tyrosine ligase-like protein 9 n=1 Tax=Ditylenchus destructor TaxID=166010 RepID=A0AAD4N8T7_9BILA|nr:tubulin-tyrosine ligase family domain-containing protein [Ditylenchus destructor]
MLANNSETAKTKKRKVLWKCALNNTILDVLNSRPGWSPTLGDDWIFFWVNRDWMVTCYDRHKFKEGQLVCHFRNDFELTRKDCLIKNHKKFRKNPENTNKVEYLPASYVLPLEYHLFVEEFRKYPPDTVWIMKPVAGAQGKGIFLFRKLKDITEWKKKDKKPTDSETQPYVVQSYIHNPYLIGGKKFDIRLYILVTSFRPLNVWIHREGFARFSHSRYSLESVEDAYVHLTNVAIAKSASDYDPEIGLKWSLDKLKKYLQSRHGVDVIEKLLAAIGWIVIHSLRSVQALIMQDAHCFELYGYDVILDEDLKPWLLEVNASPSLTPSSQEDLELKCRVLNHMLDVLDLEKVRSGNEITVGGFDLLVRNSEPLFCPDSPANASINPQCFVHTLNIRLVLGLGSKYIAPAASFSLAEKERTVQLFASSDVSSSKIERSSEFGNNPNETFYGASRNLTEFLLSQHNRNAPPDAVVDVHYELELVHILGIDELKQTLTALVYVDERWTDPTLSWRPENFGGIKKTWLPMTTVWMPDIIVFNIDGTVESSHPAVYTITCEINIKHFPLDTQKCALEIASWAYSDEKIRLHAHVEHSLDHYAPNEEWFLLNVSVVERKYEHEGISVSEIHYEIAVKRKPLFYMATVTFPSYVMCAISIVGLYARFSTNSERQERFSLGVTAILTSAVLSLVVSEKVPHSSTSVPLLVAYFLFNMLVISVAAMMTGVVMRVHRLGRFGEEPPVWLLRMFGLSTYKRFKTRNMTQGYGNHVGSQEKSDKQSLQGEEDAEWTEDLVRQKQVNFSKDSALHRKLCTIEVCLNKLCELWNISQPGADLGILRRHQLKIEQNGYVRIAERLDCCLMSIFLTLLTIPVVYLFSSM